MLLLRDNTDVRIILTQREKREHIIIPIFYEYIYFHFWGTQMFLARNLEDEEVPRKSLTRVPSRSS